MASNLPKALRIKLRRKAWNLACRGYSQDAIAEQLSPEASAATGRPLSQPTVSRWLAEANRREEARLAEEVAAYRRITCRQIDRLVWEAFQAFERSMKPKKKATVKKGSPSGDGSTTAGQTTQEVVEREGDPEWLADIRASLRLRMEATDRMLPPAPKDKDAEQSSAGDLAGALIEAERRALEYQPEPDTDASTTDAPESPADA